MTTVHKITEIYKFPIIAKEETKGFYKIRLHDGRVSEMYSGSLESEIYIEFQKKLIMDFLSTISSFEDWKIEKLSYDSMNLCKISIPVLTDMIERKSMFETNEKETKEIIKTKTKFYPIDIFPFTSRAVLCKHFDNLIITLLVSNEDELGPRKWIVKFNNKNIYLHLKSVYGRFPKCEEIIRFKELKKTEVIEKMSLSCESAKWTLFETIEPDSLIGFNQF